MFLAGEEKAAAAAEPEAAKAAAEPAGGEAKPEPAVPKADGFPPTFTEKPRIVPNETGTLVTMKFKVHKKCSEERKEKTRRTES